MEVTHRVRRGGVARSVAVLLLVCSYTISATAAARAGVERRGFELVTPSDKSGGQITLGLGSIRAAAQGNGVVYDSNVALVDTLGTGAIGTMTFRSDRTPSGWTTRALMPKQDSSLFALSNASVYSLFTPSLDSAVLRANDPALVENAPTGIPNLYLTDGYGGTPQVLTKVAGATIPSFTAPSTPVDVSDSRTKVALESIEQLTPDAPVQVSACVSSGTGCRQRLYVWDQGILHLAGVLPDGSAAPGGAVAGPPGGALTGGFDVGRAFSDDGARLYFTAPPAGGALYLRETNAENTKLVAEGGVFQDASSDGSRAVFMTSERLVSEDTDDAPDLYLYTDGQGSTGGGTISLVSQDRNAEDGNIARVDGVLGMSDDGERIYFAATGQIVLGAPLDPQQPKLYLWDHGEVRYIASLISAAPVDDGLNWSRRAILRTSRVSPNGRFMIFTTAAPLAPGFADTDHKEIYRFDADDGSLICVSCGQESTADASLNFTGATGTVQYGNYESRALSSDGSHVFFNTAKRLVPADRNSAIDAYLWADGTISLLSGGQGRAASYFADASASGNDAYIITRDRLVAEDQDSLLDLYDVRIDGGGLGHAARQECGGEACQGAIARAPTDGTLGSLTGTFAGRRLRFHLWPPKRHDLLRWAKSGTVVVRIDLPSAGRLDVRLRSIGRRITRTAVNVTSAKRVRVALQLPRAARLHLERNGHLHIVVYARFSKVAHVMRFGVTLHMPRVEAGRRREGSGP